MPGHYGGPMGGGKKKKMKKNMFEQDFQILENLNIDDTTFILFNASFNVDLGRMICGI